MSLVELALRKLQETRRAVGSGAQREAPLGVIREVATSTAVAADVEIVGPFELGRNGLALGEWLCRHDRRDEAEAHLAAARALFAGLDAEPWRLRAERALAW